jgi:hypothetical protein
MIQLLRNKEVASEDKKTEKDKEKDLHSKRLRA